MWLTVSREKVTEENCWFAEEAAVDALPDPAQMPGLGEKYREALLRAQEKNCGTVCFPAFPAAAVPSLMFQASFVVLKVITEFHKEHNFPEKAVLVCDNDETFKMLMVVWNMYYAGTKDVRMNDGRWD